jgi:hypothetical protein
MKLYPWRHLPPHFRGVSLIRPIATDPSFEQFHTLLLHAAVHADRWKVDGLWWLILALSRWEREDLFPAPSRQSMLGVHAAKLSVNTVRTGESHAHTNVPLLGARAMGSVGWRWCCAYGAPSALLPAWTRVYPVP